MNKLIAGLILLFTMATTIVMQAQILSESFDATLFPPTGWTNTRIAGAASPGTWLRITAGTNPTCTPHSGAGMAYYNSFSWSGGNASDLATPALDFSSGSFAVSFWMYRDAGANTKFDSIAVYVDVNTSSAGGTRIGLVNRLQTLAPVEAAAGWYQYTFNIPSNYNGPTNHIIFKATSDFGNRMFIDDVSVYALVPPNDLTGITASNSDVCQSLGATLYASGVDGTVYWYADSCSGIALGTGDSIVVTPSQATTYYARNYKNNLFSTNCTSLAITVYPNYLVTLSDTICARASYTLANGTVVDTSGLYLVTVPSINGCDSTISLTLTVLPQFSSTVSGSICSGQTYQFNGSNLAQAGTYFDTLVTSNGCDSIITLNLTVASQITSAVQQTICATDSILFDGAYLNQAGTYNDTLTAIGGCDSIVTLQLTILPTLLQSINAQICDGAVYNFNGTQLTQAGSYNDTLTATSGCDSIVTLQLTILPTLSQSISAQICNGAAYNFNGTQLNQGGVYYDTLTASTGCDSLVTLTLLTVNQLTSTINQTICFGDSVLLNGNYYSQSGTFVDTLQSSGACDSIVTLNLAVSSALATALNQSICFGDSISFGGVYYTSAAAITDTLTASTGCDSIVTFTLTVNTIDTPTISQNGFVLSTQSFQSYQWQLDGTDIAAANDSTFTAASNGLYTVVVTDTNGCSAASSTLSVTGVGIDQLLDQTISIYPNPAKDFLMIANLPAQMVEMEIYNSVGQLVTSGNISNGIIDVVALPVGWYLLSLHTKDSIKRIKFVKQ
jgi:hypothetical protein